MKRCVVVGAAPIFHPDWLLKQIRPNDTIICADGGYQVLQSLGISPTLLVGDFDSYHGQLPQEIETIRLPVEKDDTDMMFCIKEGIHRGYDEFLLLGGLGGRLDHTIANLSALLYLAERGIFARLCDEQNEAFAVLKGDFDLIGKKGELFSVFPFGTKECCVSYQGLQYPLSKGTLTSSFPLGVSNCIQSQQAKVIVHEGPALFVFSKDLT